MQAIDSHSIYLHAYLLLLQGYGTINSRNILKSSGGIILKFQIAHITKIFILNKLVVSPSIFFLKESYATTTKIKRKGKLDKSKNGGELDSIYWFYTKASGPVEDWFRS